HGGVVPGGKVEPNCKPNYQSVMNYLFQVGGLVTPAGAATIDLSRQTLPGLMESGLDETSGIGPGAKYRTSWYAPLATNFLINSGLTITPATRRCDGTRRGLLDPEYVRIDGVPGAGGALDWNGDGQVTGIDHGQDANLDGLNDESFAGANDFNTMDLRQVGA